jgi:hypothetical protein
LNLELRTPQSPATHVKEETGHRARAGDHVTTTCLLRRDPLTTCDLVSHSARLPSKVTVVRIMLLPFPDGSLAVRGSACAVHRPFPAPPGRTQITGRVSGRNAHPAEPPGTRRRCKETSECASAEQPCSPDRAARSARGCVQDAAAHDRKPGGARNSQPKLRRLVDAVETSTAVHYSLPVEARTGDLLMTSRNLGASYSLYQHQYPHGSSHEAHDPRRLPPSRTMNRTTGPWARVRLRSLATAVDV